MQIASVYAGTLNNYPEKVTLAMYQWAEYTPYSDAGYYPEYPQRWTMVAEPLLENELYISYNVTKNFATYHRTGSTVVNSTSDNSNVKVIASKYGNSFYITIINSNQEEVNVTLYIYNTGLSSINDLEGGTSYTITNNKVEIGTLDGYKVKYLGWEQ